MRRRIAVLLAQLEESTQKRFVEAFLEEAFSHDFDVCVFSMYQKYQETEPRAIGDGNIFTLLQFDKFDALVLMIDTIQNVGQADRLERRIKQRFNGPVVVIDKESKYFENSVMIDHYTPVTQIMEHLILEHDYKKIAFLGGREGHPHSIQRLNAYRDMMDKYGLTINEDWVYSGNYWYDSGFDFANKLLEDRDNLPEVVLAANDYMAIGLASKLDENCIRIPQDIAIAGYDSNEHGQLSPEPITSAEIPADTCGKKALYKILSLLDGTPMPEIKLNTKLYIGNSCGCKESKHTFRHMNRESWKTHHSAFSYYSDFNHITDDILSQNKFEDFYRMMSIYTYQIRPFEGFWMCLNSHFLEPIDFIGEKSIKHGYTEDMYLVIHRDSEVSGAGEVSLDNKFNKDIMLPELMKERNNPTAFYFLPMFFEDVSFGYVVFNGGDSTQVYNKTVRLWLKDINQCIEAFYRQKALHGLIEKIQADQIRDSLTGLYNYDGFYQRVKALAESNVGSDKSLGILLFDLNNLKSINTEYGRAAGDTAIVSLANYITRVTSNSHICGRLCNDEFLIGYVADDCEAVYNSILSKLPTSGVPCRIDNDVEIKISAHHAMQSVSLKEMPDLDVLINSAVNAKNRIKNIRQRTMNSFSEMTQEEIEKCRLVEKILDKNLLCYHFQPIIDVENANIFGYEALMRYEKNNNVTSGANIENVPEDSINNLSLSPFDILQCAESLGRLYDVEKHTFSGILNRIEEDEESFNNKKVFINSMPAYHLKGDDMTEVLDRLNNHNGQVVIEFTEESEVDDKTYDLLKSKFSSRNAEIALDDYGSGYSNANNILRYHPGYVKVDRTLISDIDTISQKRYFVQSLIEYARANDIKVLAEGVETREELRTVILLGADYIQGYFTGRPNKEPLSEIDLDLRLMIRDFKRARENQNSLTGL